MSNMNKLLEIKKDYHKYTDRWRLIQPIPDDGRPYGVSGNGILYTAHYILALVDNQVLTEEEKKHLKKVFNRCKVPNELGVYHRNPDKIKDYNSYDDIYGLLIAGKYVDPLITQDIYDHGQWAVDTIDETEGEHPKVKQAKILFPILKFLTFGNVKHVWNNVKPNTFHLSSWLGRRPDVIATIRMAANKPVGFFHWIYWSLNMLGVYFQNRKSNHNAFILRYTAARAVEGYGFMTNLIIKLFKRRFRSVWNNLGEVKVAYYNNPNHPDGVHLRNTK